jgi:PAS domain S-box-containing protein
MRNYMRRLLASNYEVEAVADGEAALASIDRKLPDLVLTDIMMPRLNGFELLARLRSNRNTRSLPIILVSARAGEEAKVEGLGAGADDYLVKPFAARELLAKVAASITAAGLRRETERLLRRNQELLAGQKGAFQAAVNGAPLEEALGILVRTATEQMAGNARCAFYVANREGTELRHVVGMPESYARDIEGFRIGLESLACGLAIATGEPIFTHDVIEEPRWAAWLWLAEKYDYRGCWSLPVETSAGTRVGSIAMYFREPRSPTLEDRELIAALTHTASIIMSRYQEAEERAQAVLALRESEARLQAAVELVNLGRYAWNPQTNELQWDEAVRAMWGLPGGAPVDHATWQSGIHQDDLPRVEAAIARCVAPSSDGLYDVEYRVNGRDGVERWIATRGRANFENGMAISFYGVALDITAQKQVERTLQRRVETRTRDLEKANSDLRAQIERRESAEAEVQQLQRLDAIGQITSGVAHDFNNVLTVVETNARLLSRNASALVDREGLGLITDAVQRGINLTAQLLAFSRKQRLEPQEVDLNSKIIEMHRLLSATLGGTIRLRTTLDPNLWRALVDPSHLESIVMNLVINARDAMLLGGLLVIETFNAVIEKEPSAPHEPARGQYVGLSVIDTGTGISDDVLPRIFEPFFTTKEPGKGSGLGLAQVFGFAKQSGGGVSIDTRAGHGTAVRVYLPLVEPASSTDRPDECDTKNATGPGIGARVLVVDNDTAVLRTMVRLLESLDFETLAASSGAEALQLLGTGVKVDVVLTDLAMPEMSGVELTRIIRINDPALPVILVTGCHSPEILSEFGDDEILQKPFADEELFKKISSALT